MSGQNKWWVRDRRDLGDIAAEDGGKRFSNNPPPDAAPDLETLTKAELVAMAEAKQVDSSGTKADLVERLSDG